MELESVTMDIQRFMSLYMDRMVNSVPRLMTQITRRCHPYVKGERTQDTPAAKHFENHMNFVAYDVMKELGIEGYPAVCESISDTSIETDSCILQLDAKVCRHTESSEFRVKNGELQIQCGVAQTSLSSVSKGQAIQGLQKTDIDGKPVYTLLGFLRWGYTDRYFAESLGIVLLPHDQTRVKQKAGKCSHQLRLVIGDPELWRVHTF